MSVMLAVEAVEVAESIAKKLKAFKQSGKVGDVIFFNCSKCGRIAGAKMIEGRKVLTSCDNGCFRFSL